MIRSFNLLIIYFDDFDSKFMISWFLFVLAQYNASYPCLSLIDASAWFCSRNLTTGIWLYFAAKIRGVCPSSSWWLMLTPQFWMRSSTTFKWPMSAATPSGVLFWNPSQSARVGFFSNKIWRMSLWPPCAANITALWLFLLTASILASKRKKINEI